MSRPKNSVPSYRLHKQSGQAVVTLTDPTGRRRDVLLGKYNSAKSKADYVRVLQEWSASDRLVDSWSGRPADLTVAEVIDRFYTHAETYYRHDDGTPTSEVGELRRSLRPLKYLHGSLLAAEFSPLKMKAVRELMVQGYDHPDFGKQPGLSRGVVNQRVSRIKHLFKWAVENELVPANVHHGLFSVAGLRRGRTTAYETEPVKPVPLPFVEATIAKASPAIGDMIRLQLLAGIRPGELLIMRAIDIDMTGPVWMYTPKSHKTAHHGHSHVIAIGPQGQEIIRRYLTPQLDAFLFSPRAVTAQRRKAQRAARKSKVQPSQVCRKKANPKKQPGVAYLRTSYSRAVARAAAAAGVPHWHPHQLRHTRATEIRKTYGIDAARAVLGHRTPAITEVYAELDQGQAAEIMAKIG